MGGASQQCACGSWKIILLLLVVPKCRSQPVGLLFCRAELVAPSVQGGQLPGLPGLDPQLAVCFIQKAYSRDPHEQGSKTVTQANY